jgi:ubiquinone/menaquinone biosynthesis C-methylase UbiE
MSVSEQVKKDYDNSAVSYNHYSLLPSGILESQLVKTALGDCTGMNVLDLGGGTGLHARQAIDLGATSVDVVDISRAMLKIGQHIETSLGRTNSIRFIEADVAKSLSHLPLREDGYDVVMANWIFSFADTMELLEHMFGNIIINLKPGGRFVGVRDADPWSPVFENHKYGASCTSVTKIPGGVKYHCILHCDPPIEFEASSLEVIYSGSSEIYEKFGLTNVQIVPYESAEVVQKDPEFWKLFLERPSLAVVQASKKLEQS